MYPLAAFVLLPEETRRRAKLCAVRGLLSVPRLFETPEAVRWFWQAPEAEPASPGPLRRQPARIRG